MDIWEFLLVIFAQSVLTMVPAAFLCFFTVREKLKKGLLRPMFGALAAVVPYTLFAMLMNDWLGVNPNICALLYIAAAFLYLRRIADVLPFKLWFIMMVVINYMFCATPLALLIVRAIYAPIIDPAYYMWPDIWGRLLVTAVTLPPVAWVMRKKMWPSMRDIELSEWKMLWLLPLTFTLISIITFYITGEFTLANWSYAAALSLLTACAFSCYVIVLRMLQRTEENARSIERMRQMDSQLKMQAERFEEITSHIDEMRLLRHDMRHHMAAIHDMLSDGKIDKAREYLKEYANEFQDAGEPSLCQNFVVDIIARRYAVLAKKQDIKIDYLLSLPQQTGVADTDLCIVLGNLIENAMNACRTQLSGRKFLRVEVRTEENKVLIAVDNSIDMSSKQIGSSAGLGIPSVRAIAKKYSGMAGFEQKNGVFQASVLLYCKD